MAILFNEFVKVFGVADEGAHQQTNFLIGEEDSITQDGGGVHGPDAVISLLHSRVSKYPGAEELSLHADNCPGNSFLSTLFASNSFPVPFHKF